MQPEIWRAIDGFNHYEVSTHGRCRRVKRFDGRDRRRLPSMLSGSLDSHGYVMIELVSDLGTIATLKLHRLVAATFLGQPTDDKSQCNHRDGVKTNNAVENLEWVTPTDNMLHAYEQGLHPRMESTRHPQHKLTHEQAEEIRARYARGGVSQTALASEFGVSQNVVHRIVTNKAWHPPLIAV